MCSTSAMNQASNNQGCFNLLCQGFVQVTDKVALGGPITPLSVYNGPNYEIVIKVFKVKKNIPR